MTDKSRLESRSNGQIVFGTCPQCSTASQLFGAGYCAICMMGHQQTQIKALQQVNAELRARSETPAPIPDSIAATYTAKIERDAVIIKTLRDKLVELCDRLNWKGPGRESNIDITVREARAIVKSFDQIAAGVAFITDERLGGP